MYPITRKAQGIAREFPNIPSSLISSIFLILSTGRESLISVIHFLSLFSLSSDTKTVFLHPKHKHQSFYILQVYTYITRRYRPKNVESGNIRNIRKALFLFCYPFFLLSVVFTFLKRKMGFKIKIFPKSAGEGIKN